MNFLQIAGILYNNCLEKSISTSFFYAKPARPVYLITLFLVFSLSGWPQTYPIGHRTITFTDSSRANRPVPSELYYPATSAGEGTSLAAGLFPVIVFGHGFQMGFDSYAYFKNAMVPAGYLLVFPKTETSLSPSHEEYGADLAFLVLQMKTEGLNPASPFFTHIDSTAAIMGHSMGGGASFLGCRNNTVPTVMVTWAAAETSPSAISAARDISIPSLVFAADKDCVTPPVSNQIPMYDSLASGCKVFINIRGGGHCYFADANFICSLGELGCPAFTITREQQHSTTLDFTRLFLDFYLKKIPGAWTIFNDSLNNSPRITFQKSCTTTSIAPGVQRKPFIVFPNPSGDFAFIEGNCSGNDHVSVNVFHVSGRAVQNYILEPGEKRYHLKIDMSSWAQGVYLAEIRSAQETRVAKIVKN
jgi:pimeloyl-ACP methyl ester carboxylesterase